MSKNDEEFLLLMVQLGIVALCVCVPFIGIPVGIVWLYILTHKD